MYKNDFEKEVIRNSRKEYSIDNIDNENEFKINLFDRKLNKFQSFKAFDESVKA